MQVQLLKEIHKTGKPIILALFNGSPITINWAQENIPAIIECWYPGEEVVQLYIKDIKSSVKVPKYELKGFKRIYLEPQESKSIEFTITPRQLSLINEEGRCVLEPGEFKIYVGGQQPDERSKILTGKEVLSVVLNVKGEKVLEVEY